LENRYQSRGFKTIICYNDSLFGQHMSSGIYFGEANQPHLSVSTMGDAPHVRHIGQESETALGISIGATSLGTVWRKSIRTFFNFVVILWGWVPSVVTVAAVESLC
jgi:hypothetical protein